MINTLKGTYHMLLAGIPGLNWIAALLGFIIFVLCKRWAARMSCKKKGTMYSDRIFFTDKFEPLVIGLLSTFILMWGYITFSDTMNPVIAGAIGSGAGTIFTNIANGLKKKWAGGGDD